MPESIIQRSMAGGEIAPALYGRADQTKYQTGLKTCRNFVVLKHGGVGSRAGTQFIAEVKDSSKATYLMKFVFNNDQTYIIEVGEFYFRFIRDGAAITVLSVPYEIATPYAEADLADLQFVQSGDVVTITHENYAPRDLSRLGHTSWTLTAKSFAPSITAPVGVTNSLAGAGGDSWVVTALKTDTYEESVASTQTISNTVASSGTPVTVSWTAHAGAAEFNIYKAKNGIYGYVGSSVGTTFVDNGITQDMSRTPPVTRDPFNASTLYPAAVNYYEQRLMFANQLADTQKVFASRSGAFNNFTISSPLQSDDAVTFRIAGRQVNAVRHMLDIGALIILTQSGEWLIDASSGAALIADQPTSPKQIGYNGASRVMPVIINDSALFVQDRGEIVRDLRYTVSAGGGTSTYKGRDLTVFSTHMFLHKTITRMDYSQNRNSVAWAVRDDGILLGITYLTDHEIWGWHRHDTDGLYEDVKVVPEGRRDVAYFVVKRTIDGVTKRYIEREADRDFVEMEVDATFLDSYLTYDGRNTGATTVTLSGSGWTVDDLITVTAASGTPFVSGDVGNEVVVWSGNTRVKIAIATYSSATSVSGYPSSTVPAELRNIAFTTWGKAVDLLDGLGHLEGKDVAVVGDGNVVGSPNNPDYSVYTVSGGQVQLDVPYLVIHVGLSYVCDLQTLDLDLEGQQVRQSMKNVNGITILTERTRGLFAGPSSDELDEFTPSAAPLDGQPLALEQGLIELPIAATWDQSGSVFVRQKDPLPATILSIIPSVSVGG